MEYFDENRHIGVLGNFDTTEMVESVMENFNPDEIISILRAEGNEDSAKWMEERQNYIKSMRALDSEYDNKYMKEFKGRTWCIETANILFEINENKREKTQKERLEFALHNALQMVGF